MYVSLSSVSRCRKLIKPKQGIVGTPTWSQWVRSSRGLDSWLVGRRVSLTDWPLNLWELTLSPSGRKCQNWIGGHTAGVCCRSEFLFVGEKPPHLVTEVFLCVDDCCGVTAEEKTQSFSTNNILPCTGLPRTTKNHLAQNVNSAAVENPELSE